MSSFRVVCTEQTGCSSSGHIIAVGTGTDPASASTRRTVAEVWTAIVAGHTFYTVSPSTGKRAQVERYYCGCGRGSLRSTADSVRDNNLDSLRLCSWKS